MLILLSLNLKNVIIACINLYMSLLPIKQPTITYIHLCQEMICQGLPFSCSAFKYQRGLVLGPLFHCHRA